ncbi:MAG: hypothetical protein CSA62_05460 [Planctomycetota bacterium]|nr:MAG: hypothetical protein CSA62_05460 [Planctomycetota bacterium]
MTRTFPWISPFTLALLSLGLFAADGSALPQEQSPRKSENSAPQGEKAKATPEIKGSEDDAGAAKPKAPRPPATEKTLAPYLSKGFLGRLLVAPKILALPEETLATRYLPLLTGDGKFLTLKVRNLVSGLGDVRYVERERSERTLLKLGPSIALILEAEKAKVRDTEARIRLDRVLSKLSKMGNEDILRKALYARGLAEALEYREGEQVTRALLSGLDHLDARVRIAAIRSLGTRLEDPANANAYGEQAIKGLEVELQSQDLQLRNAITVSLGAMPLAKTRAKLIEIASHASAPLSHRLLALRLLSERMEAAAFSELASQLSAAKGGAVELALLKESHGFFLEMLQPQPKQREEPRKQPEQASPEPAQNPEPPVAKASAQTGEQEPISAQENAPLTASPKLPRIQLGFMDGGVFESVLQGMRRDRILVAPSSEVAALGQLRLPRASIETIIYVDNAKTKGAPQPTLVFRSGTLVAVQDLRQVDGRIHGQALGHKLDAPASLLTRLKPSPGARGAPGGSREHDQLRIPGSKAPIDGELGAISQSGFKFVDSKGKQQNLAWDQFESLVLQLRPESSPQEPGDLGQFVQANLIDKQVVVGYLLDLSPERLVLASPALGVVKLPSQNLLRIDMSHSGRAQTGFTLITDSNMMEVFEIDGEGQRVWTLEALYAPVAAKPTPSGNVLVVEQEDNAVREYDRDGTAAWEYPEFQGKIDRDKELNDPRDADRLSNGNTLITDYGNARVIEVSPEHEIVWSYGGKRRKALSFEPYNADRLSNGNTLITDYGGSRIIEVDRKGEIVWEYKGLSYPSDADRLPNGNTLVVCSRPAQVIEISPGGQIVWELKGKNGLRTPVAVERLPDGTTMVCDIAGNGKDEKGGQIRFFNRAGRQTRKIPCDFPQCAKRY